MTRTSVPGATMNRGAGPRLLLSHALSATAMSMPWPALLAEVWSSTHSDLWLGVTGAARLLPYVLLSAAAGILADRFRRSKVLRWSAAIRAVLLLGCAVAVSADQLGLGVGLAVLTVAAGTPAYPAAVAAMPNLSGAGSDRLTGLLVTVEVTAFVVGPAVGGLLLGLGDGAWSVTASVVFAVLAVPLLHRLDSGPVVVEPQRPGLGRLRTVLTSPGVPMAIAVVALVNFVEAAASVALLPLSLEHWHAGDQGFGLATAALGFGSLAAPLLGLVVRLRGALLLNAGGFGLSGAASSAAFAAGPLAVAGAAGTVVEVYSTEVLQHSVPDHVRAFSLGVTDSVMVSAAAVGALIAPQLSSLIGPVATFVGLGLILGCSVVVVARVSHLRRTPAAV
ncbi:MAG: MFS transporter [Propionibacteriaceae bacterium]